MGHWTLQSATPSILNRDVEVYGHYFSITFRLKYSPSMMGSFTETPAFEWKETITMIERTKGTWWSAEFDQFQRLPDSPTFYNWTNRYILAHSAAVALDYSDSQPSCLYDKNGNRLPANTFTRANTQKDAADQVRNYLKKNGGVMVVTVTDKPGIMRPTDATVDKLRILTFDCGLQGMGNRITAIQQLKVVGVNDANWTRSCTTDLISQPFQTQGLNQVNAPADVTRVTPFGGGPHDGTYV